MLTLKSYQNFWSTYRRTVFKHSVPYPACPPHGLPFNLVSPSLHFKATHLFPVVYAARLKSINHPLRLLVENEIYRLTVWANLISDPKRGSDHHNNVERGMLEVSTGGFFSYSLTFKPPE